MTDSYKIQEHIFQLVDLRALTYTLPAVNALPIIGGHVGATLNVPIRTVNRVGENIIVPQIDVQVTGDPANPIVSITQQTVPIVANSFTVPTQINLPVIGGGGGTVTIPAYAPENTTVNETTTLSINAFLNFKVKEIRFSFAYDIIDFGLINFVVSSPLSNNDIVGNLNKFSLNNGLLYYYVDGFKKQNEMRYIFEDPIKVFGSIPFTFRNLNFAAGNTLSAFVIIHMECLA